MRSVLRGLWHVPERLAHPVRRRRARRRLEAIPWPHSVLFVCHGNICRSPYAAELFRERAAAAGRRNVEVASAGFIGPDRRSPPAAREVASERGIDLEGHRSRVLSVPRVEASELIVAMERGQRRRLVHDYGAVAARTIVLGELDPEPRQRSRIHDPVGSGPELFRDVYARIDRCVEELVAALSA